MALIKCSKCGKEISDKANSCIHCGNIIEKVIICPECKNEIKGNITVMCPNCGYNISKELNKLNNIISNENDNNSSDTKHKKTNLYALMGFILALVSFLLGWVIATISIVLSIIGLKQIKEDTNQSGKELAIAGISISIFSIIIYIILMMLLPTLFKLIYAI